MIHTETEERCKG